MDRIVNALHEQTMLVVFGVCFAILIPIALGSKRVRSQMRKGLIFLLIVGGICAGYYFITGKSPAGIPSEIDAFFNGPQVPEKTSHRYYSDPEKRFKDSEK